MLQAHRPPPTPTATASTSGILTQQAQQQQLSSPGGNALLVANVAMQEGPSNSSHGTPYTLLLVNSALLCSQPVSQQCIDHSGTDACLNAAYQAVNPDNNNPPCPASDGYSLHNCLTDQANTKIIMLQDSHLNLSTCPPALAQHPFLLTRNITIMSDPRGPRLMFDCGSLSDRVQVAPGLTFTLQHMILANCSTPKAMNVMRMSAGVNVVFNDSVILQAGELCLPTDQSANMAAHQARPRHIPGRQVGVIDKHSQRYAHHITLITVRKSLLSGLTA
jgi:hypothetical protein